MLTIICKEHGVFDQAYMNHYAGNGCIYCAQNIKYTYNDVIAKCIHMHDDLYTYVDTSVDFYNSHSVLTILCKEHGVFKQNAYAHYSGSHCPQCSKIFKSNNIKAAINKHKFNNNGRFDRTLTYSDYIARIPAQLLQYQEYQIDVDIDYATSRTLTQIVCTKHGNFESTLGQLHYKKCPKCKTRGVSKQETDVFNWLSQYIPDLRQSDRTIIKPYELDIVSDKLKIAIEYNGEYWHRHSEHRHKLKTKLALQSGYNLLHIPEARWCSEEHDIVKLEILAHCSITDYDISNI
jgi:very-short-patch-repair endonuclease